MLCVHLVLCEYSKLKSQPKTFVKTYLLASIFQQVNSMCVIINFF